MSTIRNPHTQRDVVAALKKAGFVFVRTKGDHHIYSHPRVGLAAVPMRGGRPDISHGLAGKLNRLVRLARTKK